ncbi:MAG: class I SAM-dependent methyltransferase [Proteobacteria bacterium]|nr:class I SAM-dependent methyltransferase [Pseudomonadota bacterium]
MRPTAPEPGPPIAPPCGVAEPRPEDRPGAMTHFGYRQVAVAEKSALVRQHFDRVAPTYDLGNTLMSLGLHHHWKRAAVRRMDLRKGDRVLDVCGGTGDLALLAARQVGPSGRVLLYDCNPAMIAKGVAKASRRNRERNLSFMCGDAERIAGPAGTYDAAMMGFGVRNLTRMELGLREIYRVLRPGGQFLCLEFSRPEATWFRALYDAYSFHLMPLLSRLLVGTRDSYLHLAESIRLFPLPDQFAGLLEESGFRDVSYERLTNGIVAVHRGFKPPR